MIPCFHNCKSFSERMGKVVTEAQEKSGDLNRYLIDLFKNHKIIKFFKEKILKKFARKVC